MAGNNRRKERQPKKKTETYWQRRARQRRAEIRARRLERHGTTIDPTLTWFVAHTAANMENRAADGLFEEGFGTFLPEHNVEEIRVVWKLGEKVQKRVEVERPFFPGYVFLGMPSGGLSFSQALAVDGVAGVVLFDGEPCQIDDKALQRIKERIDAKRSAKERAAADLAWKRAKRLPVHDLKKGQDAKVASGTFEGFMAHVLALVGSDDVKVSLMSRDGKTTAKITATLPATMLAAA